MGFSEWLGRSLSSAFGESAARKPLPERTIEQAQNNFFEAIVRERLDDIDRIAERYPNDFLQWRDHSGQTPLQAAQNSQSLPSFVQLVSLGADKNESYGNGWNPLMKAFYPHESRYMRDAFIDYLLGPQTQNLNAVATVGELSFTMLHMAVMNRDAERVLQLVEFGADQNVKAKPDKKYGEVTPEELAMKLKLPKIAEILKNADGIREVKRKEWAELEEYAKAHTYVPRGDDPNPVGVGREAGDDKQTTIIVDTQKPAAPAAAKPATP